MGDTPEVEIEFLPGTATPVGLGEPGTTVVAPAIGNAIFAASGARLRHLPIRPEAVRQALPHRTGLVVTLGCRPPESRSDSAAGKTGVRSQIQ